jgi:hypothetical protein
MFEKKYVLLRSQKKKVYDILREAGLEPAEFSWSYVEIADQLLTARLNYRSGEQYYFQFSPCEINAWCVACPGTYRMIDQWYPKNWDEQEAIFEAWAQTLKNELDTPDPWADLAKYRLILNGDLSRDVPNEAIAAVEAEQIQQALVRLAERATQTFSLSSSQTAVVRARLEVMADAARRERSRDWVYTVIGVWTSTAAALALTEEQATTLWGMLKCELGSFVNLLLDRAVSPAPPTRIVEIKSRAPASHHVRARKRS